MWGTHQKEQSTRGYSGIKLIELGQTLADVQFIMELEFFFSGEIVTVAAVDFSVKDVTPVKLSPVLTVTVVMKRWT